MTCCPSTHGQYSAFRRCLFEPSQHAIRPDSVDIPLGVALLGTSAPYIRADGEGPLRRGHVASYSISKGAVTNAEFKAFVDETGYITEAEYLGWSFVFWSQVPSSVGDTQQVPGSPWWHRVDGASWHSIAGPDCALFSQRQDHPVVHISWNDAVAYCSWLGGRLPTELEWEHAARGGLGDVRFPWGDAEPDDAEAIFCNIWQGRFPQINTQKDGYDTTAPSISFESNGYGLFNTVGNTWEWTTDTYRSPVRRSSTETTVTKLAKGGSFLCHKSYCFRYRIAARMGSAIDSATTHMGFRIVWDN